MMMSNPSYRICMDNERNRHTCVSRPLLWIHARHPWTPLNAGRPCTSIADSSGSTIHLYTSLYCTNSSFSINRFHRLTNPWYILILGKSYTDTVTCSIRFSALKCRQQAFLAPLSRKRLIEFELAWAYVNSVLVCFLFSFSFVYILTNPLTL